MANLHLDLNHSLELRVAEFKSDSEKMAQVNEFLTDIFESAQKEAEKRNGKKSKLTDPKKSECGLIGRVLKPVLSLPDSLPPSVIVPIQCGLLLFLAIIIIKKVRSNN